MSNTDYINNNYYVVSAKDNIGGDYDVSVEEE